MAMECRLRFFALICSRAINSDLSLRHFNEHRLDVFYAVESDANANYKLHVVAFKLRIVSLKVGRIHAA